MINDSLEKEEDVMETDLFNSVLYDRKVWRQRGESMTDYILRRNCEFEKLHTTVYGFTIPMRTQAHWLLQFAALSEKRDQKYILSSVGNAVDNNWIERAPPQAVPQVA